MCFRSNANHRVIAVVHVVFYFMSAPLDSNQEPQRYKLCALTIELGAVIPNLPHLPFPRTGASVPMKLFESQRANRRTEVPMWLYVLYALLACIVLAVALRIVWLWRHGWIYFGYGFIAEYDETRQCAYIASRLRNSPAGRVPVPLGEHLVSGIPIGAVIIEWDGISFENLSYQEYCERVKRCAARHWRQETALRLRDVVSGEFTVTMKSFLNTTLIPTYGFPQHPGDPRHEHSAWYDPKTGWTYYSERFIPEDAPGCD
jgi:hypothetical protein